MLPKLKQFDIFISYVVEDRELVENLYQELQKSNLKVWYAKQQLVIGSDLTEVIKEGLKNVRYGILIISPNYKGYWSDVETFVLLDNKNKILPILHNTSLEEAVKEIPILQQIWCANTEGGVQDVAKEVSKRIKPKHRVYYYAAKILSQLKKNSKVALYITSALLSILALLIYLSYQNANRPSRQTLDNFIEQRLATIETLVKKEFEERLANHECSTVSLNEIKRLTPILGSRRFLFHNGVDNIHSPVKLKSQGIIPSLEPIVPPFGLSDYKAYLFTNKGATTKWVKYALVNLNPHTYTITDKRFDSDIYEVDISYSNPIRYIEVFIDTEDKPHSVINLIGTKPKETFVFEKNEDLWIPLLVR